MLRVTAFTGGSTVPSARFRVRQYIPWLAQMSIEMTEAPARFGSYPPAARSLRPAWGALALTERFCSVLGSRNSDLTLLQREMLSTLATVERFTKAPRILDVDDAIWLLRGGRPAIALARCCELVICGNEFIADFFRTHAPNVVVLPTPVDTDRFCPGAARRNPEVICWSGSSSGLPFLYSIEPALSAVLSKSPARRLRVVCDAAPRFSTVPADRVEFIPWSESVEVAAIQDAGVALMPLDQSPWSRGKCSYKMLTYMACAVPLVATPIGMNRDLLSRAPAGLPATTQTEWADAIETVLKSPSCAAEMGAAGRDLVQREYSLHALSPRMAGILRAVGSGKN